MRHPIAVILDLEHPPHEIQRHLGGAGRGLPGDPGRGGEVGAGGGVHVAGDEAQVAGGVAPLGRQIREGADGVAPDPEVGDFEASEAEVEGGRQVLLRPFELGVLRGRDVGVDAVRPEHQRQRLVGPGAVRYARQRVDGRRGGRRTGRVGQARRNQRVDEQAAADRDERAQGPAHVQGGDEHADLEHRAPRIRVAVRHGAAHGDDRARGDARRVPAPGRHHPAVQRDFQRWREAGAGGHGGQRRAGRNRNGLEPAALVGQGVRQDVEGGAARGRQLGQDGLDVGHRPLYQFSGGGRSGGGDRAPISPALPAQR